jgi:hypothetical protein
LSDRPRPTPSSDIDIERLDFDDAVKLRDLLKGALQDIDQQLGDKTIKRSDTGTPITKDDYAKWRNSAIAARRHTLKELRRVKARLRELNDQRSRSNAGLYRKLRAAIERLVAAGEPVQPASLQTVLDSMEARDGQ